MTTIKELLQKNKNWAREVTEHDPNFFPSLAEQQNPDFLWIGCSDSRVAANTIVGLMPGEVFVHRNISNLVVHTDINCLSVMQFAVEVLQVEHIIVCGHYGCGGVKAALSDERNGLIDNWLRHIQDIAHLHAAKLNAIDDAGKRLNLLCELNVAAQVINVGETSIVQDAWNRGQSLEIHGWIYGLKDGIIRDLGISVNRADDVARQRDQFLFQDEIHKASAEL